MFSINIMTSSVKFICRFQYNKITVTRKQIFYLAFPLMHVFLFMQYNWDCTLHSHKTQTPAYSFTQNKFNQGRPSAQTSTGCLW